MFAAKNELFTRPSASGYTISRSVRTRSSASAYFNRTFTTPTSTTKWTWSAWVKRGTLGSAQTLFSGQVDVNNWGYIQLLAGDTLSFSQADAGSVTSTVTTTQVFRDPSAWYHIVVVFDSTQATAANRLLMYVNGVQITSFGTATYLAQNTASRINSAVAHQISRYISAANYFDGYLTEINFIDGQALTPTSFGQFNSVTGVWQPIKYTGTYGTNGFYLNFSDNSNNTSTTIGKDYSGNGNNWTPNNISVTAGSTYDSMLDVPTPYADGGNGRGNYCVINPLDGGSSTATTLSEGNLKSTAPGASTWGSNSCTMGVSSGKWYWEQTIVSGTFWYAGIIIGQSNWSGAGFGQMANGYSYYSTGQKQSNNVLASYGASFTSGDVIGVALDMDAGTITFYKNNASQGTAYTGLTGVAVPAVSGYNGSVSVMNFGQRPFTYTPPSGFNALNTQNLPAPTISNGALYMNATTYSGTTGVQVVTNSGGMQPDLVWIKLRNIAGSNVLQDSVRGTTAYLQSNATSAENTTTSNDWFRSFNSNGFTVASSTTGGTPTSEWNTSGNTYVGWQWQAGKGTTSSNTSGSITSTVSVNATAGFSVVTYTGTGANATVGHGLGVAPSMIITKSRNDATYGWTTYHTSLGAGNIIFLNTTAASSAAVNAWNNTAPTSSVFSLGTDQYANFNTKTYVAYCFSAVKGYSAFGSYTGNGSTDGPFIFTGFRPRYVMIKRTDSAASWYVYDTARAPYNTTNAWLQPDTSSAENSATTWEIDILSNGFKIRNNGAFSNASGGTYLYACFAENPYKLALAR